MDKKETIKLLKAIIRNNKSFIKVHIEELKTEKLNKPTRKYVEDMIEQIETDNNALECAVRLLVKEER
jgi:hypothetical protein